MKKTKAQTRFGTPHKSSVHLWHLASELLNRLWRN
jgi:hypothetical protein